MHHHTAPKYRLGGILLTVFYAYIVVHLLLTFLCLNLSSTFPPPPLFLLKVTKDDVIVAEKLEGDIGTTLEAAEVLLVGTRDSTVVGRPTVPGATVKLYVEEQTRDKKVLPRFLLFLGGA